MAAIILLGTAHAAGQGQNAPASGDSVVQWNAEIDGSDILIGDHFIYRITLDWDPAGAEQPIVDPPPDLGAIDIVDWDKGRVSRSSSGRRSITYSYTLTTFESGDHPLPEFPIHYRPMGSSDQVTLNAPSHLIQVRDIPPDNPDQPDIRQIAGIMSPAGQPWLIAAIVLAVVALVLLVILSVWLRRRKSCDVIAARPQRPIEELALEALDALEYSDLIKRECYKEYYGRLSWIIREYMGRRFHFAAIDMTSYEIETVMGEFFDTEMMSTLRTFDEYCDLVKFARWIPDIGVVERSMEIAREMVRRTTPENSSAPDSLAAPPGNGAQGSPPAKEARS